MNTAVDCTASMVRFIRSKEPTSQGAKKKTRLLTQPRLRYVFHTVRNRRLFLPGQALQVSRSKSPQIGRRIDSLDGRGDVGP